MNSTKSDLESHKFNWKVASAVSVGLAVFLLLVQPFDLETTDTMSVLIILGLIPLNFAIYVLIYLINPQTPVSRLVVFIVLIIGCNASYLGLGGGKLSISLLMKVIVVSGLIISAIALWQRSKKFENQLQSLKQIADAAKRTIVVSDEGSVETIRVPSEAIHFVKAEGNYVRVVWTNSGKTIQKLLRTSLSKVESQFQGNELIRCHRSYLVSVKNAERIEGTLRGAVIKFADGDSVPVSRSHILAIRETAMS